MNINFLYYYKFIASYTLTLSTALTSAPALINASTTSK